MTTPEDVAEKVRDWHIALPDSGNPHELLGEMRAHCLVAHSDLFGGFHILTRYEDMVRVLQNYETFSNDAFSIPWEETRTKLIPLGYNPPEHTAYRRVFASYFGPRAVTLIEPSARARFQDLVRDYVAAGGGDFIDALATPFPCITFLEILGIPISDLGLLAEWKNALSRDINSTDPALIEHAVTVIQPRTATYFAERVTEREAMADQPDDLLTAMVHAEIDGQPFTLDDR